MKSANVQPAGKSRKNRVHFRIALLTVLIIGLAAALIFSPDMMRSFSNSSSVSAAGEKRIALKTRAKFEPRLQTVSKAYSKKRRRVAKKTTKLPDLFKID